MFGRKTVQIVGVIGVCAAVGGCATPGAVPPAPTGAAFCTVATPLYWSPKDTRKTKEQIDTHNRIGVKLCPDWGNGGQGSDSTAKR